MSIQIVAMITAMIASPSLWHVIGSIKIGQTGKKFIRVGKSPANAGLFYSLTSLGATPAYGWLRHLRSFGTKK